MALVALMLCSIPLFWRRAAVRVTLRGFELANETGREIQYDVLKEMASHFSFASFGSAAQMRSGTF